MKRIAIVTGASSGMGREFVLQLSNWEKFEEIWVIARRTERLEELAKEVLSQDVIGIDIDLNAGSAKATAWGCDLTYDYVKINGDYRS